MRLSTINDSLNEKNELAKFSMWLLSVGNGTIRKKKLMLILKEIIIFKFLINCLLNIMNILYKQE